MSLIAGRGCRWPPRRDSVSPVRTVVGGGRDTHDGHENSPILVFFSNLLGLLADHHLAYSERVATEGSGRPTEVWYASGVKKHDIHDKDDRRRPEAG